MDPAGLLISIATIAYTLDELTASYHSASDTLSLIKTHIKILETGATRIQEWLHYTDLPSQMQVMHSLRDAVATVNSSLQRLQWDIEEITHTGPKTAKLLGRSGSDQWMKTKFTFNEARLRKHLTDVRECASLVNFTLNVCQLPVGKTAEREVRELEMGAKALQRVQTSARRQRRSQLQDSSMRKPQGHSDDYNTFMKQVLDAEADLPDEETPTPSRQPSAESAMTVASLVPQPLRVVGVQPVDDSAASSPQQAVQHPSELFLPDDNVGVALSTPYDQAQPLPSSSLDSDLPGYFDAHGRNFTGDAHMVGDHKALTIAPADTPPIPPRSLDRGGVHSTESSAGPSRSQMRRKPLPRASRSGNSNTAQNAGLSVEELPYQHARRSSSGSPADSALYLAEKMTPLTQSLSSLTNSDYLNVELDQPPVQPYAGPPPLYDSAATPSRASPELVSTPVPLRNTAMSSNVEDYSPYVVRLAQENRIDDLMAYLRANGNVNEPDARTGRTAIMEATRYRRWDICRLLLQSGARLYLKDCEGDSALHVAARGGDSEICQMLLDSGAQSQDCNGNGQTPVELAAAGGHTEAVLCLVNAMKTRKPNDPIIVKAFLTAVKLGDVPTAGALLAADVKPKKLKETWQPICLAAQSGSLSMLDLMLAAKCTLKDRSPAGWAALHAAARYAHKDANVTMKDADNQEAIHHAVRQGNVKLTVALIDGGAKLNSMSKYGWSSIHLAAAYGHAALLAECMTRGINIEERTTTPSFKPEKRTNAAARRGYWAEIRWPHSGARPLELALEFGHDDAANMLISGGAKIDEGDSRAWRPLHYAAFSCRPDMVDLLLQKGATADAKTVDGHTALTLGFREFGLTADRDERLRVVERLEIGMAGRKKSRMPSLTGFMASAPSQSKTAIQRNLAWHTAQLAEALYQPNNAGDYEDSDDEYSIESAESGTVNGSSASGDQDALYAVPTNSSQAVKR
ncbi:hypothetical protein LTR85_003400 [Meristemomyces frigidus]|nr:hypothetical protein LTR85_003400 [Meristemomyces frigidus]